METFFKAKEMLQSCSKAPTGPAPLPPATCHPRSRGTNHGLPLTHAPGAPTTSYIPLTHVPGAPITSYLSPTLQGHQPPATSHPLQGHQPLTRTPGVTALQGHQPRATTHPRSRGTKHQPSSDSMWFKLMEWCTGVTNPYPRLLYPPPTILSALTSDH